MKKTSKPRKRQQTQVLQVRVMSPRIAWFRFLRILGQCLKFSLILGILGAAGWGAWKGVRHAFYENPDFSLRNVELNPNNAIDEFGIYQVGDIDPQANLFSLDLDLITKRLRNVPALSMVHVERRLPGTLYVRVLAREPFAWVSNTENPAERKPGAMLVDHEGYVFPCTTLQFETAARLPIIFLPESHDYTVSAGKKIEHPEFPRCLRLLDAAFESDSGSLEKIESLRQANSWSLELITRDGVVATFGLGDHERQISNFRAAVDHVARSGQTIATINLIPKVNVPVTLRSASSSTAEAPKAIIVPEPNPAEKRHHRRARDLDTLLNSR